MRRRTLAAILLMTLACGLSTDVYATTQGQYVRRPRISIDEALQIARGYIEIEKIDVSQYYLDSVKLNLNPRGDRGKYWEVRWEMSEGACKGCYILLLIYMDKSVERIPGK